MWNRRGHLFILIYFFSFASWYTIARDFDMCNYMQEGIENCENSVLIKETETQADSSVKKSESFKQTYLGIASGIKYQSIGGVKEAEVSPSFLLSIMFNVNEHEVSYLGVELKYYKYGWNTKEHIDNVFFLTPFYQWNSKLFSNIYLAMQIGVTVFSNNAALFFSNSLDIGLKYKFNDVLFFAKNSFNVNYLLLTNIVSITNIGVYIIL